MKVLFAVLALVACVSAEWTPKTAAELNVIGVDCRKEYPLSEDVFQQVEAFVYPDEEPVRKYIMCYLLKMGLFSTDHGYNADRVVKQLRLEDNSEMLALAQDCVAKNPKVEGQANDVWAFKGNSCIMSGKLGDRIKADIKKRQEAAAKTH